MVLSVLQEWKTKFDQPAPCYIGLLSLDVHKLLVYMLTRKQFSHYSTKPLQSYLTIRPQVIKDRKSRSDPRTISCMLITTNKLLFAYADDILVYCEASTNNNILQKSQTLREEASKWYESCLLKLIIDKTQFCNLSNQNIKGYYHIIFHNTKIESTLH